MIWDEKNGVRPWLTSTYSASDWTMSPNPDGSIYIIERYYDNARDIFMVRLFLAENGVDDPVEIKPWFQDNYRFGEAGFAAINDTSFVFVKYPDLYKLNEDGSAEIWKEWQEPLFGLRHTLDGNLLLRGESDMWLTDYEGNILRSWSDLIQPLTTDPPFSGNQIFDSDYNNGELWLAYWGHRKFEFIKDENRTVIKQFESPFVPHAVAVDNQNAFVLASTIEPSVSRDILPNLWRFHNDSLELIWGENSNVTGTKDGQTHIPSFFELKQNYPNPFNPITNIEFVIPSTQFIEIQLFNLSGELIKTIAKGQFDFGKHTVHFDASGLTSGVYYYKLTADNFSQAKKMVLLK